MIDNFKWYERILAQSCMSNFTWLEKYRILICTNFYSDISVNKGIWGKSAFSNRASIPFTTTWCEQAIGEALLNKALTYAKLHDSSIVCDLGCGDGRYVKYLLNNSCVKIIALNYELEPLISLANSLTNFEKDRVLLICSDVNDSPIKNNEIDFIIAWSLFTSVSNFELSLQKCISYLKHGSFLLNAEPVLEQALIYALLMNDINEFQRILSTKTRAIMWDQKNIRYRVFTYKEIQKLMNNSCINRIWESGVDSLPSFLFGGFGQNNAIHNDVKQKLWEQLVDLQGSWYRQLVFFSQKI